MSSVIAYGSITLTDISDLGELSVQPTSNLPLSVIYDPNQQVYNPNWVNNNLTLTPLIYYGGQQLTGASSGIQSLTWKRQLGVDTPVTVISGSNNETIQNNGNLIVSGNKFSVGGQSEVSMVTYIVTVVYREPVAGVDLTAIGQITFTLTKHASNVKNVRISGDTIFKYDSPSASTPEGNASIVLHAYADGVSVTGWQFKNNSGNFIQYPVAPDQQTGDLTVTHNDTYMDGSTSKPVFKDNKCVIRVLTNDPNVWDEHAITKLYNGAAGTDNVSLVLTNDDQMIPYSGDTGDFDQAQSRLYIYDGPDEVTSTYSIVVTASHVTFEYLNGLDGSVSATPTTTVHITNFEEITSGGPRYTSGSVQFACTKGNVTKYKTFSVAKVASGADGQSPTIYSIEPDTLAIKRDLDNALTPSSLTIRAYSQTGANSKSNYAGRFKIYKNKTLADLIAGDVIETGDNKDWIYQSSANQESYTISRSTTPSIPDDTTSLLCVLYAANGFTNRLDAQQVVIVKDGPTGATGDPGETGADAINIIFGNFADVLNCNHDNTLAVNHVIRIPFTAYEGTTPVDCTVDISNNAFKLLNQAPNAKSPVSDTSTKDATSGTSYNGEIVWTLTAGKSVSSERGVLYNMPFVVATSAGNKTVYADYSWTRSSAAKDGKNAVMLQIFTPNGTNVFTTGVSSLSLTGQLTDGATPVSSGVTWQWAKWQEDTSVTPHVWKYTDLSNVANQYQGVTTSTLTVYSSMVDSYASFSLTATYGAKSYVAYYDLFDKTDPIQVAVMSSIGTQLVNGRGYGALYVKVTRNGQQIDNIATERFGVSDPNDATVYYRLNTDGKTVTLRRKSGGTWNDAAESYTGTYTWSWRDKDGNAITAWSEGHNLPTTGKVIYIDGDMIDSKIIADVAVTGL